MRKSGVSRTHSLPNDSYMCRDRSTAEGSLGHRSWGLPKAQSGTRARGKPAWLTLGTSSLTRLSPNLGGELRQPKGALLLPRSPQPLPEGGGFRTGRGFCGKGGGLMGNPGGSRTGGPFSSSFLLPRPPHPAGSVLSVHSQPADTSYILQLPKDVPRLLQPHGAPTWGTIPKLPPPGRSPLAQRPLRRQVSRCGEVGLGRGPACLPGVRSCW